MTDQTAQRRTRPGRGVDLIPGALTRARQARGLSDAELGALAGVSGASISAYECGRNRPSPKVAAELARVLKVPLNELRVP